MSSRPKEGIAQIWLDITRQLNDLFPGLNLTKDSVHQKWQNLKDTWVRYHKQKTSGKSGQARKFLKKYIYYDAMAFLLPLQEMQR
jgi:Alcohol dehydrogenase transcription factor Myb/SANT-like